ncbi:2-phospho-L-lactate guanylyltransferase [Actinomycetospora endophytica]|uniref:Phosphoenolpyruvate guanylyltransferase n=1 Tax=Actinomycetospora endophytica TaxID=2291215 RepID=A0ABS8PFM5_9PSEU|nr:2-phospho-L-lactate guanylyltransferase [Actinomycetospora endophytica]MCD2197072.1 2-phospho-L-lactate guanylyltransferase [Actinomycetospora endophytica]
MAAPVDLVVPIKELRRAKSRLVGATADLAPTAAGRSASRAGLALALASDTLAAVLASSVRRLAVVTSDPHAAALIGPADGAKEPPRAVVVDDPGTGLNAAVLAGADHLRGGDDPPGLVAALLGDVPALRPAELDEALAAAAGVIADGAPAAFVADHTGDGTTLLVLSRPGDGGPHFGPSSARVHETAGAVALTGAWPGLRHDVDVPEDLDQVRALGVGPATRAWPDVHTPAVPLAGCR